MVNILNIFPDELSTYQGKKVKVHPIMFSKRVLNLAKQIEKSDSEFEILDIIFDLIAIHIIKANDDITEDNIDSIMEDINLSDIVAHFTQNELQQN